MGYIDVSTKERPLGQARRIDPPVENDREREIQRRLLKIRRKFYKLQLDVKMAEMYLTAYRLICKFIDAGYGKVLVGTENRLPKVKKQKILKKKQQKRKQMKKMGQNLNQKIMRLSK